MANPDLLDTIAQALHRERCEAEDHGACPDEPDYANAVAVLIALRDAGHVTFTLPTAPAAT